MRGLRADASCAGSVVVVSYYVVMKTWRCLRAALFELLCTTSRCVGGVSSSCLHSSCCFARRDDS